MKKKVKEGDEMLPKYLMRIRRPKSERLAGLTKFEKDLVVAIDKACENPPFPPERIFEPPCAYCGKKNPEFIVKYPITPGDIPDPILYLTHRFYTGDVPVCSRTECQAQLRQEIKEFEKLKWGINHE